MMKVEIIFVFTLLALFYETVYSVPFQVVHFIDIGSDL